MAEQKVATLLDLDSLLDTNLDKVETLPDFVTPPPGLYVLNVPECKLEDFKSKDGAKGFRIRLTYEVEQTVEISSSEMPVANKSRFSESFMGTEDGLKFFKKAAMSILGVKDFEGASIRDVMDAVKGATFKARITIRKTAGEGGKTYENIQVRGVADGSDE